jgi:acetate kinase
VSNDIRDIGAAAEQGNARAKLALEVFVASARHWIGAYFFEMGGADALVFTAGIGENRADLRAAICANLEGLGIALDTAVNQSTRASEMVISRGDAKVRVLVVPTNEELVVAREVQRLLQSRKN